jgi:uncharacterized membrane protein
VPLVTAFLLGMIAGLRSLTAPAVVSWAVQLRPELQATPVAFMTRPPTAYAFTALALIELVTDKLPFTPSRLSAVPLAARIMMGALCGGTVCSMVGYSLVAGAVTGGVGGWAGALAGDHLRRYLTTKMQLADIVVAIT